MNDNENCLAYFREQFTEFICSWTTEASIALGKIPSVKHFHILNVNDCVFSVFGFVHIFVFSEN